MTQEEKAKRYDSMFERLKEMYNNNKTNVAARLICERYFPELKECEDERMIQYFKDLAPFDKAEELYEKYGFSHNDAIAWLEKQAEYANFRNKIQIGDKVTRNEDGVLVNLSQLNRVAKKQTEQKLYVNDNAKEMFIKALECVEEQNAKGYKLTDCDKNSWWEDFKAYTSCIVEQKPWSEEDERLRTSCIKHIEEELERIRNDKYGHSEIISDLKESCRERINWLESLKGRVQPQNLAVTDEELIKARNEAYNDTLDKLEYHSDTPTFNDGWSAAIDYIRKKFLKDRVQPQNIAYYNPYKEVVESIAEMCKHYDKANRSGLRDFYDNVKVKCKDAKEYDSLYPQSQWKPSDEQMDALHYVTNFDYGGHKATLVSLYEQLMKLKE